MALDDQLITLEQLRHVLETRFDISYSVRMLRYVLKALDVHKVAVRPNESTGKGQVAYYHPAAIWLIASAHNGQTRPSMTVPADQMRHYRDLAVRALKETTPERVEQLTYWLAMTGPEYGMRIADLRRLVASDPSRLDLVPGERDAKLMALEVYKDRLVERQTAEERRELIELIPYEPPTLEQERFWFAESVLRWLYTAGIADSPTLREGVVT